MTYYYFWLGLDGEAEIEDDGFITVRGLTFYRNMLVEHIERLPLETNQG